MEKNWDTCVNFTLSEEGYISNDAHDAGKFTKFGVSTTFYNDWLTHIHYSTRMSFPATVAQLTLVQAKGIYHSEFWVKSGANLLPSGLDAVVFDTAVNSGVTRAKQLLALTSKASARAMAYEYLTHRHDYLASVVQKDHSQAVFLAGWMNRVSACKKIVNILAPGVVK